MGTAMRFTLFTCFTSTKVHILTGEVGQTTEAIELKTEYCDAIYLLFLFFSVFADNRGRSQHEQHRAHRGVRQAGGGLSASVFVLLTYYSKCFCTPKASKVSRSLRPRAKCRSTTRLPASCGPRKDRSSSRMSTCGIVRLLVYADMLY